VTRSGSRPRVVYWNNIPSPYAVARLNAVAARGNVALEAWFCSRTEPDRSWAVSENEFLFPWRYLPGGRVRVSGIGPHYFNLPVGLLTRDRPDLLVSLYSEPAFVAGWWAARTAGMRVAFRYLPTFDSWVPRSRLKERLKRTLFTRVDGFKTPGPAGRAALETYGVDPERIHTVTPVDRRRALEGRPRAMASAARSAQSGVRGCGDDVPLCGALVARQGRRRSACGIRAPGDLDTSLLIAGDGVDEVALRARARERGLRNVRFLGFRDHDDLPRVYAAADALVFPTLADPHGLVVEEAMASGLPVVSSEAASDIKLRVPEGVAGFVVPPANPGLLADRMRMIAVDPSATRRMGDAAATIASSQGHGRYADDFERFVERVLTIPRARGQMVASRGARTSRPRVIYWNNIPAPYMVERFNAVIQRGNVDLEAWFGARTDPDRSWTIDESTWRFPYRYLPRVGIGRHRLSLPTFVPTARRPDLLVSLYATPSFLVGLRIAWWRGWRTALWVEVTFDSWIRRRRWKEALKRAVFQRVDGVITAGQDGRAFAMRYGVPSERVHIARHVVDSEYFATEAATARPARDSIRSDLGLSGVVFVYVGRLWWVKGTGPLLAAYAALDRELPCGTSLLLIGDGPDKARISQIARAQGLNVKLAGFHQRVDLPRLYAAGDVFVFPSLGDTYGLVVDEAMAAGLPVISTTAAGEIRERVVDGVNGYLVPPNDPGALAAAMQRLAVDPGLRIQMGARSAEMIAPYTPDCWAAAFEKAVESILSSRRIGSPS
jgi:glycosyltransferase involved in cell wall biosynthesis